MTYATEKRRRIERELRRDPHRSDRAIAEKTRASHVWVGVVRKQLDLEHPDVKRIGRDKLPRRHTKRVKEEEMLRGLYGKVWKHYQAVIWELGDFDLGTVQPSDKTNVRLLLEHWKSEVEKVIAKLR